MVFRTYPEGNSASGVVSRAANNGASRASVLAHSKRRCASQPGARKKGPPVSVPRVGACTGKCRYDSTCDSFVHNFQSCRVAFFVFPPRFSLRAIMAPGPFLVAGAHPSRYLPWIFFRRKWVSVFATDQLADGFVRFCYTFRCSVIEFRLRDTKTVGWSSSQTTRMDSF